MVITYFKLLMTAFFWGGTFIAGRLITASVGPYSAAFIRFFIASIFLLLMIWKSEGAIPIIRRNQVLPVLLLAMTGVVAYNICFFNG
jgi:drug/metabolite transporter (DMT)-like permease